MKRLPWIALYGLLAAAPGLAAPNGVPARVESIGIWYDHNPDPSHDAIRTGEPWTGADVAGFLELYPQKIVVAGYEDAEPPGFARWHQYGQLVRDAKAVAAQRGASIDGRICVSERIDVLERRQDSGYSCRADLQGGGCDWEGEMDGSFGEAETVVKASGRAVATSAPDALADPKAHWVAALWVHRLLVLRPGGASQETRRIVSNDVARLVVGAPWRTPPRTGDAYEIRGSFDPAWVARVSRTAHQATIRRFWTGARNVCGPNGDQPCAAPAEPLDPFDPLAGRAWDGTADRAAIEGLADADSVPALYGFVQDQGRNDRLWEDPYFRANGVILNVDDPAYRDWRTRYIMYKLRDLGIEPGDTACVDIGYKPGMHTWYDTSAGVGTTPCSEPDTGMWRGPSHICRDGSAQSGALEETPFGPGVYEHGVSEMLRTIATLLPQYGWSRVRILTEEPPAYRDIPWSIIAEDVRKLPEMIGYRSRVTTPLVSNLAYLPPAGAGTAATGSSLGTAPPAPTGVSGGGLPTAGGGTTSPAESGSAATGGSAGPTSGGGASGTPSAGSGNGSMAADVPASDPAAPAAPAPPSAAPGATGGALGQEAAGGGSPTASGTQEKPHGYLMKSGRGSSGIIEPPSYDR